MDAASDSVHLGSALTDMSDEGNVTYINIKEIIPYVLIIVGAVSFIILTIHIIRTYNFGNALSRRMSIKRRRKRYHSDFDDVDF